MQNKEIASTTCGQGLAQNASLPDKLGELTAAFAENLEIHMKALGLEDPNSKREYEAYQKLATAHREIAMQLVSTARHMVEYKNLSMGAHSQSAMTDPIVLRAYKKLVKIEQELQRLLEQRSKDHQQMLDSMNRAIAG